MVNTLLELLGIAAVCTGVAFIFWPAALIVGGTLLVLAANLRDRRSFERATVVDIDRVRGVAS